MKPRQQEEIDTTGLAVASGTGAATLCCLWPACDCLHSGCDVGWSAPGPSTCLHWLVICPHALLPHSQQAD